MYKLYVVTFQQSIFGQQFAVMFILLTLSEYKTSDAQYDPDKNTHNIVTRYFDIKFQSDNRPTAGDKVLVDWKFRAKTRYVHI